MDIRFIRNDKDHRRVLTEIERSWDGRAQVRLSTIA